jgi:short-subunit dehydrogenase
MAVPRLKPIGRQTIVLTGATSGIGLATARLASERGARLLLVARNEDALGKLCAELRARGGHAEYAVADVADQAQVQAAAARAVEIFGGFDTWVNDAGAFIYGAVEDVAVEDQRRLFDVVYWGTVYGTLAAGARLKAGGGAIVNVGSVLGEFAIPFQGPYCAAKFAVKGFTEAYRRETEAAGHPISLTLIKPAAIDTSFMEHARNAMGSAGTRNPPPAYHPHLVARAILHGAEHRARDITVGGAGGFSLVVANQAVPRLMDWVFARAGRFTQTTKDAGDPARRDNLYAPRADLDERSTLHPFTRKTSLLLEAQLNPAATALAAGLGALCLGVAARGRRPRPMVKAP